MTIDRFTHVYALVNQFIMFSGMLSAGMDIWILWKRVVGVVICWLFYFSTLPDYDLVECSGFCGFKTKSIEKNSGRQFSIHCYGYKELQSRWKCALYGWLAAKPNVK